MGYYIKINNYTSGSLHTVTFGDFNTFALAKTRLDTEVISKSAQLSYNLQFWRDNSYDGFNSSDVISVGSYKEYYYLRNDTKEHVYTAIIYNEDYPYDTVSSSRVS